MAEPEELNLVDPSTIMPTLAEVADAIPSRTRNHRGVLQNTFNADTEPNAEAAQRRIDEAARYVASKVGSIRTTWPNWFQTAKDAVKAEAARQIEARAPERSDAMLLKDLADSAREKLQALIDLGQEDQPGVGIYHAAELVSPYSGDDDRGSYFDVLD